MDDHRETEPGLLTSRVTKQPPKGGFLVEEVKIMLRCIMLLLLLFSFLAGFVTILAPCIWPVLPIVLSSSIAGKGHARPLGITLGVILSFSIFTLSISYLVHLFNLDPNIIRTVAVLIIGFLGLTMVIPALSAKFEIFVGRLANIFGQNNNGGSDFLAGLITGLTLGLVWSPCAGPILASVAALAATGQVSLNVVLVTIFYVTGVGIPLFLFAYGGQKLITNLKGLNKFTAKIQSGFGVLMILAALAIYSGYDQTLQLALLNRFPALGNLVNGFEKSSIVTNQLNTLTGHDALPMDTAMDLFNTNVPAPKLIGIDKWLNTDGKPVTLEELKGKVVLVDFWTYTCINCIRTLPHVTGWYEKYKDQGFVILGIHTPEFEFEKDTKNVESAIKKYNIHYPVAQDNDYATWNAYANNYWPAEYLIDAKGNIRRTHFGEGEYADTERAIQALLEEAGKDVGNQEVINMPDQTPKLRVSPETYLGSARSRYSPDVNIDSSWKTLPEYAISAEKSVITYNFLASKVYITLRPGESKTNTVKVFLDDKLIDSKFAGTDVKNGVVVVDSDRLYNLVDLKDKTETHTLKLEFENAGIEAFTFTFG